VAAGLSCLEWDNFPLLRSSGRVSSTLPPLRFDRTSLGQASKTLLRDGRWANARVMRVSVAGRDWVLKDFAPRAWWVRNTIGRLFVRRELATLQRLPQEHTAAENEHVHGVRSYDSDRPNGLPFAGKPAAALQGAHGASRHRWDNFPLPAHHVTHFLTCAAVPPSVAAC
jgi:hypothetical protein